MERAHPGSSGPVDPESGPPEIPDHRLLGRIGGGGYGEVWLAENSFGTRRAVKVVYRRRFERREPYDRELEGVRQFEPLSRLHEGLVDVLQIGQDEEGGWFYYVMELADPLGGDGEEYAPRTLQGELARCGRLSAEACLRIGLRLADALEFLHEHGRVHRDVKPSNVVFVEGVAKLADIGLVARSGSESMVGTDGFIAPEGPGKPPADIYGLGKVLYELSTGKDRNEYPDPLTRSIEEPDHVLRVELNQVVLKACDPDPARRYQTATQLKQDLLLLQAGGSVRELRRLRRRYARMRRLGLVALVLAMVVGGLSWAQWNHSRRVAALAEANRRQVVHLHVSAGVRSLEEGDLMGALPWFVEALRLDAGDPVAALLHRQRIEAVRRQCPRLVQMGIHEGPIHHLELSSDGGRILTTSDDGTAMVWDLESGEELTRLMRHDGAVVTAAFSPDGEQVATGGIDGVARLWDARTGEPRSPPLLHGSNVVQVTFSPDGRLLASASVDGTVRLFDTRSARPAGEPLPHAAPLRLVTFSPDGRLLATGGDDRQVTFWEVESGRPIGTPLRHPASVRKVLFTGDGQRLLTAGGDGAARLWSVAGGELLIPPMTSSEGGPIHWVGFDAEESRIVTAGGRYATSGEVRVWKVTDGLPLTPALRFGLPVRSAVFSPDGRWIGIACLEATDPLWDAETGQSVGIPLRRTPGLWRMEFTRDGRRVVTSGRDGIWRLWDLAAEESREPFLTTGPSVAIAFSPDGRYLATGGRDGGVCLWEVQSRRAVAGDTWLDALGLRLEFSPDGQWLAAGDRDGKLGVWGVPDGGPRWFGRHLSAAASRVRYSPDGLVLATACLDGTARLWSSVSGEPLSEPLNHALSVLAVAFSPDGRWLATGTGRLVSHRREGEVRLWDVRTGQPATAPWKVEGCVSDLAFSPDGRRLAAASADLGATPHRLVIWDVGSGEEIDRDFRHEDGIECVVFRSDGRRLATAGQDATAGVWDLGPGEGLVFGVRHRLGVSQVAFSPDDRQLLTASTDRSARLWDAATGEPLGPPLRHRGAVPAAIWSPDGTRVATASEDGTARIWEVRRTDWPEADLALLAEVLAGGRIDRASRITPLDARTWREQWRRLKAGHPAALEISRDDIMAWHWRQVEEAERRRQWPAVRFHLRHLLELQPADSELERRLRDLDPGSVPAGSVFDREASRLHPVAP